MIYDSPAMFSDFNCIYSCLKKYMNIIIWISKNILAIRNMQMVLCSFLEDDFLPLWIFRESHSHILLLKSISWDQNIHIVTFPKLILLISFNDKLAIYISLLIHLLTIEINNEWNILDTSHVVVINHKPKCGLLRFFDVSYKWDRESLIRNNEVWCNCLIVNSWIAFHCDLIALRYQVICEFDGS
jgi:hypothetical protein